MFEYGSRSGIWRLVRIFEEFKLPATVIACGLAIERNQEFAKAIKELGYDICAHGWRWEYHSLLSIENERELISKTFSSLETNTGVKPSGWYCRYGPSLNTRNLLVEHGGFLYDSDSYSDDRPYWIEIAQKKHLVIPYSLVCNDANFLRGSLGTGQDFFCVPQRHFRYVISGKSGTRFHDVYWASSKSDWSTWPCFGVTEVY